MFYDHPIKDRQARLDWLLLIGVVGLMAMGVAYIFSATMANEALSNQPWYQQRSVLQAAWYLLGSTAAVAVCLISYHTLARWSLVAYWACILLLLAVLIPGIGAMRFGARRWIDLGFFQMQPSEFAKLAFILAQAHFLSRPADELAQMRNFLKSLGLTALPFLLILKEPDLGSSIIFLPIGLAMLFAAGAPARFLRRLVLGVAVLAMLFLVDILFAPPGWQIKLQDYQRRRLLVYFGKDFAPPNATEAERQRLRIQQRNDSYNVEQALICVGSGGLTGKGWRQGTQIALGYLPRAVAHNDFIFSVIAEESGFVGSVFVITLYGMILFSGIKIASEARDRLGKMLAVGVVTLFFSHLFINIGMNIRLMPVTGVPLPLLSYGGSSVLCSLIAIGLLQNVFLYRRSY
jgi:rod shape determining protein RodA